MQTNRTRLLATTAVVMLLALLTAGAAYHHGWANYDQTTTLNLTGPILEPTYENPHGMMKLQTEGKTWTVVLAPPERMRRRGLARAALAAGRTATVVGYPHKKVADEMRAERITLQGTTTELR